MKFTIVVHSSPYSSQGAHSALRFCKAVVNAGHEIYRLFFFRDGVSNLNSLAVVAQDEVSLQSHWDELIAAHKIDTVACVTSSLKRGVVDQTEAARYELPGSNLSPHATIAGLGQLVDATDNSDRVVNFG